MTSNASKKRKCEDEKRGFNLEWEENYAFTSQGNKPLCLICHTKLSQNKGSNVKRHHETNHKNFSSNYPPKSDIRKRKLTELKSALESQQRSIKVFSMESDVMTEASFVMSWNIARAKHPYSDCEFVKKNIADVVAVLEPNNKKLQRLIEKIPCSRRTTQRRISQISADIEVTVQNDLKSSVAFSLALDESTDIQDNPQLAIFVRYISSDMTVKEELLNLVALRETTRGIDIKNALNEALASANVPLNKFVSVATDGAPAMVGKHNGLIGLMKSDPNFPEFFPLHCIIHREHLVAKFFKYEDVMKTVIEIVNFIRVNAKNHRQFRNFVEDLELEDAPSDVSLYCIVRWLSTSNLLSRFVDLLNPIIDFLEVKGKMYPQLKNNSWMQDLMFLTDVMKHLQNLNLALQGSEKVISDLAQTVLSFQKKIKVFQRDIMTKSFYHFPNFKMRMNSFPEEAISDHKTEEYKNKLQELLEDFQARFEDLQELKPCFAFLINPFNVNVVSDGCPVRQPFVTNTSAVEMELIEMQEDMALKNFSQCYSTTEFWRQVPESKYPELKKNSSRLISVFSTTYCCESLFSVMKFIKSKQRATLTNEHLGELIRTALTTYRPNFRRLANQKKD